MFLLALQKYNLKSLTRYGFLGGLVLGPSLYGWYKVLDHFMPGKSFRIIAIKTSLDTFFLGVPYYATYYSGNTK